MLPTLHALEAQLPTLLADEPGWQSLYVDYHPPIVERLWRQVGAVRISLHRILPCEPEEALFHPHPWPSAMRLLEGTYEMAIGYGAGTTPPPRAGLVVLAPGSEYAMTDPDAWHSVRPVGGPTLSVMVTGAPWPRATIEVGKKLNPLSDAQRTLLFADFRRLYPG